MTISQGVYRYIHLNNLHKQMWSCALLRFPLFRYEMKPFIRRLFDWNFQNMGIPRLGRRSFPKSSRVKDKLFPLSTAPCWIRNLTTSWWPFRDATRNRGMTPAFISAPCFTRSLTICNISPVSKRSTKSSGGVCRHWRGVLWGANQSRWMADKNCITAPALFIYNAKLQVGEEMVSSH